MCILSLYWLFVFSLHILWNILCVYKHAASEHGQDTGKVGGQAYGCQNQTSWVQIPTLQFISWLYEFDWMRLYPTPRVVVSFKNAPLRRQPSTIPTSSYLLPYVIISPQMWAGLTDPLLTMISELMRDIPGGPVPKTPCSQCRGTRFNPRSGN